MRATQRQGLACFELEHKRLNPMGSFSLISFRCSIYDGRNDSDVGLATLQNLRVASLLRPCLQVNHVQMTYSFVCIPITVS